MDKKEDSLDKLLSMIEDLPDEKKKKLAQFVEKWHFGK